MRSRSLIAGTFWLLCLIVLLAMSGRSQKPEEEPKFEIIEIGKGGTPKWSPDGSRLAFMSGGWLCVADADAKGGIKKVAEIRPNSFEWLSDSSFVMSEKRSWGEEGKAEGHILAINTVDMKGQVHTIRRDSIVVVPTSDYLTYPSIPVILNDGTVGYYEIHEKPGGETKIFKTIKLGRLKPDSTLKQMIVTTEGYPAAGEIWLESVDRTVKKKITPGKKYLFPILSPDNTKILAGVSGYSAGVVILNLNGEVITDLDVHAREISPGLVAGGDIVGAVWSPDSRKLLHIWIVEDGYSIRDQDIFMVNVDGTGRVAIAATPNEIERDASWSPDGKRIAYRNETNGTVFVVKSE